MSSCASRPGANPPMAPETMDALNLLQPYSKADVFVRPSSAIQAGALRLEAGYYGSQGYRAVQAMEESGFRIERVGQHARVKWFGPFARTYVSDPAHGTPFLSSSDMMTARLEPQNYLSNALTRNLERLLVGEGTILVSCSGTIGNVCYCTRDYNGHAVSQHAIRVDALVPEWRGVLYVFLLSELGRFVITRNKSGSVIESIYADDVERLPLPVLPKCLRERINQDIEEASRLRMEANRLLKDAERRVQVDCGLPDIETLRPGASRDQAATFTVQAGKRLWTNGGFGQIRLDATYHEPTAVALSKLILARQDGTTLDQFVEVVRNSTLRKRQYVDDPEDGVPLLGGKQLIQWRPGELKYLSKALTRNLAKEIVESGWTLVSCGGTLGRTLFVHRNLEGDALSQDVMRVIPNRQRLKPGFVYAFLASPYGQAQLLQRGYGSVIPRLRDFQFNSIAIIVPPDRGEAIHKIVVSAYDARADAKALEDGALRMFMKAIETGREATERKWGREY